MMRSIVDERETCCTARLATPPYAELGRKRQFQTPNEWKSDEIHCSLSKPMALSPALQPNLRIPPMPRRNVWFRRHRVGPQIKTYEYKTH